MEVLDFSQKNSILNQFMRQLRDVNIQNDRMKFRRNIERIGEILSYELSKSMNYKAESFNSPLSEMQSPQLQNEIVVCSILRAGLPLHNGILNYFDDADNAFISAYRKLKPNGIDFNIEVEYFSSPSLEGKTLILADPMLATGNSMVSVYDALLKHGQPKDIHIVSVIGAKAGVELLVDHFPKSTKLWIAAIDEKLNEKGYIVPGLGDAGDLAYGSKL
ncbi:uracil phosphoribosyltransferase [Psychroflexus aestuariivivens]|uniref:uracil phosphoribosyltransferase n=1 Tax=Psychroflexus aestuariivivens TaxID=1795040 RepID=UPI000FD98B37|nr:uracil phosphoribosyltransferase [Psychroflexus aestuariivivens]